MISRRELLAKTALGFGALSLNRLLAESGRTGGSRTAPDTLPGQGQARDLSFSERRPLAGRHLGPETDAHQVSRYAQRRAAT